VGMPWSLSTLKVWQAWVRGIQVIMQLGLSEAWSSKSHYNARAILAQGGKP
jgi:hypothetical protein